MRSPEPHTCSHGPQERRPGKPPGPSHWGQLEVHPASGGGRCGVHRVLRAGGRRDKDELVLRKEVGAGDHGKTVYSTQGGLMRYGDGHQVPTHQGQQLISPGNVLITHTPHLHSPTPDHFSHHPNALFPTPDDPLTSSPTAAAATT